MLSLRERSREPELMDAADFAGPELAESFRFIELVNRLGGGQRAVIRGVSRALVGWPRSRPVEIVDVGCGSGDLGAALHHWGTRRGLEIRYCGVDRSERTLDLARSRARRRGLPLRFVSGDLFAASLPEADLVLASMVLHHFDDDQVVAAIGHLAAKARRALIINDLERGWGAWLACLGLTLCYGGPTTRHDALLSVAKGFRVEELQAAIARAELAGAVSRVLGWRLLAVVSRSG